MKLIACTAVLLLGAILYFPPPQDAAAQSGDQPIKQAMELAIQDMQENNDYLWEMEQRIDTIRIEQQRPTVSKAKFHEYPYRLWENGKFYRKVKVYQGRRFLYETKQQIKPPKIKRRTR